MTPLQGPLTTGEAAKHLKVSIGTMRRWAKQGRVPHTVLPSGRLRFDRDALDSVLVHNDAA